MKKLLSVFIILIAALFITACSSSDDNNSSNTNNNNTNNNSTNNSQNQNSDSEKNYTLQEVAEHNTSSDCWMAIEGKVYDVTNYIRQHPGGPGIVQGCGKDATQLFNTKGNTGEDHSSKAESDLSKYYIGELK